MERASFDELGILRTCKPLSMEK